MINVLQKRTILEEKTLVSTLPEQIFREISRLSRQRGGLELVSEIRLRSFGKSSFSIGRERTYLTSRVSEEDMRRTFSLLCEGALYAHAHEVERGYITLPGGVRVGLCGEARYDGEKFVGLGRVSSMVFRIPTGGCENHQELYNAFLSSKRGMLIYSPPGGGKTTALRSLARLLAGGRDSRQVVIIDERHEFLPEDYEGVSVDILRGYKRDKGIEIALRSLAPEVIIIDEIGGCAEALLMLECLNSGVRIIASAHAESLVQLERRRSIRPFIEDEVFDVFAGILLVGEKREVNIEVRD